MSLPTLPVYLGPFEVQEAFEAGGMAVIYRAVHRWSGEHAAMKVISPVHLDSEEARLALRQEIQTIAALDHPNIVRIFDLGEVSAAAALATGGSLPEQAPWFAMEYVEGSSLLGAAPLPDWLTTRSVLLGLLDALAHAHASGVIHRDLKPGNVLHSYDASGNIHVKLVDFGIAQVLSQGAQDMGELTSEKNVSGTPRYMAPEQVSGRRREQGPWTDLYAVGCLAWYLMTGRPLYDGSTIIDVMRSHLYTATPRLRPAFKVPRGVQGWLERLLHKRICERFGRAADAAAALIALGEVPHPRRRAPCDMEATQEFHLPSLAFLRTPSQVRSGGAESTHQMLDAVEAIARHDRDLGASSLPASSALATPSLAIPPTWHRVEAPIAAPQTGASLGMFGLRTPPFLGRHTERDVLWAQLRHTGAEQKPRLLILEGSPGTGVSRLATWFMKRAHEVGATTNLSAHFDPRRSDLEGLRTMFSNHLRGAGLHGAALTRHLQRVCVDDPILPWPASHLEGLAAFLEPPLGLLEADPAAEEGALSERGEPQEPRSGLSGPKRHQLVLDLLLQMAKEARIPLLLFDDAQWGPDALDFAKFLLHEAERHPLPLLVLMTVNLKELEETPSTAMLLEQLRRHERCDTLSLAPLSMSEHRAFLDAVVHLHPKLADDLAQRTQGSPGFALQIIEEWIEQDALVQGSHGLTLRATQPPSLPQTQQELQQRRLLAFFTALPASRRAPAQRALELAATLGRHVHHREWHTGCEAAKISIPSELYTLIFERQIALPHDYGFSFTHPLIQRALLDTATRACRTQAHHSACVQMLQTLYADRSPEQLMRLAYHQHESGQLEAAEKTYLAAAHDHHRQGHQSQALGALERRNQAIQALDPIASERWCHNQLTMMQLELDLRRLHALRSRLNHLEALAPHIAQGEYSKLRTKHDYIRLRLRLAEGRLERAVSNQHELLEIVKHHPDDEALTTSLRLLAFAYELLGRIPEALTHYEYCQARFTTHANLFGYGFATFGVAKCMLFQGHHDLGMGQLRRAQEIFEKEDIRNGIIACTYCKAMALRLQGRFSAAARLLASLDDEIVKLDAPQRATHWLYQLVLAIELGLSTHARDLLDALVPLEETFEFQEAILHQLSRAAYFAMTQQWERSVSNFAISRTGLRHTGLRTFEVASLCERFASFILHHNTDLAHAALHITHQTYTLLGHSALLEAFATRHPSDTWTST